MIMIMPKTKKSTPKKVITKIPEIISKQTVLVLQLIGISVFEVYYDKSNKLAKRVSYLGIFGSLFWLGSFGFSAIHACVNDHTILRAYYDTKLKNYGDAYERITSLLYSETVILKVALQVSSCLPFTQYIVDIDKTLASRGVKVDYQHKKTFFITTLQLIPVVLRALTICATLWAIDAVIPVDRIFQLTLTDGVSLMATTFYCHYLYLLMDRYKHINEILSGVKEEVTSKVRIDAATIILENDNFNLENARRTEDNCERIRLSSKVHSMLFKATATVNEVFGMILLVTSLLPLSYIILNMFYFMEATSAGLAQDVKRYVNFLLYIAWAVLYNVLVIFMNVYFSESTVSEAKKTNIIVHDILNSEVSSQVKKEARQLSLQLLHQTPAFTAWGLITLDYALILEVR
ncbi:putative gustatory receptor 28b [Plutella xylostella]|uniref:putative gustatory receptor 28b n=1 Tax=Plutella xylostella TaxID=51655 RepID=UPI002032E52F|nr:putative gustatory receptor 28b [Plutella xylostella]